MSEATGCLPASFLFSQSSLQDFQDCPRRFYLRHIQHCAWPAVVSEPALEFERRGLDGAVFHRFVQQHRLGIPEEQIFALLAEGFSDRSAETLSIWWKNYLANAPKVEVGCREWVEVPLSAGLAGYRLIAKVDLLRISQPDHGVPTQATIIDWKTAERRTTRERLLTSLQTRVYRFLAVRCASRLNGGTPIEPDHVDMIYWFTNFPDLPEVLIYSEDQFQDDERFLSSLMAEISATHRDQFDSSHDSRKCAFCVYRSLCGTGIKAGALTDQASDLLFDDIDLGDIEEIAF